MDLNKIKSRIRIGIKTIPIHNTVVHFPHKKLFKLLNEFRCLPGTLVQNVKEMLKGCSMYHVHWIYHIS